MNKIITVRGEQRVKKEIVLRNIWPIAKVCMCWFEFAYYYGSHSLLSINKMPKLHELLCNKMCIRTPMKCITKPKMNGVTVI